MMDDCWLKSLTLFDPPVEQISIPYEGTALRGFYFRGRGTQEKRPLLILVNGSDGSLLTYNLEGVIGSIDCPMLITEPANEAFWPGQSRRLYDLLKCPKTLVPFSISDGADLHCEPTAYGLRELRLLNWLDKTI